MFTSAIARSMLASVALAMLLWTSAATAQDDEFALFNPQIDVAQRIDVASPCPVAFRNILKHNHIYSSLSVTAGSYATAIIAGIKLEAAANKHAKTSETTSSHGSGCMIFIVAGRWNTFGPK